MKKLTVFALVFVAGVFSAYGAPVKPLNFKWLTGR
jgi:hypothetical protein